MTGSWSNRRCRCWPFWPSICTLCCRGVHVLCGIASPSSWSARCSSTISFRWCSASGWSTRAWSFGSITAGAASQSTGHARRKRTERRVLSMFIIWPRSPSCWTRSSLCCVRTIVRWHSCMCIITQSCPWSAGAHPSIILAVMAPSLAGSTRLCISSCTRTISCLHLDPKCKSICGGRSTSPICKW